MPSRRSQIEMTEAELHAFVSRQHVISCATMGPKGRPHLVPLWYSCDGLTLESWTYARSQKAKNLERDPRATIQLEDGLEYADLRGAMLECDVTIEREPDRVAAIGRRLLERYSQSATLTPDEEQMLESQTPKRIGLRFVATRIVSWDHRKLAGSY